METTINSTQTKVRTITSNKSSNTEFWNKVEFSRYGIISMIVLITGCFGGIAASFGAHDSSLELALIAFPTIISLALVLAVAPMKTIIYLSSVAIILDLIVLIF
ncbi:MAG: hypothetical protein H0W73_04300 [Bacteroidetes bacterium]|nr:hypothetical protein [Bacteroidota bacterium]